MVNSCIPGVLRQHFEALGSIKVFIRFDHPIPAKYVHDLSSVLSLKIVFADLDQAPGRPIHEKERYLVRVVGGQMTGHSTTQ